MQWRKYGVILLAAMLLFGCVFPAAAATYMPGDTLVAVFTVTENPRAAVGIKARLDYDHDALELIPSRTESNTVSNDTIMMMNWNGIPEGESMMIHFRVLPNALGGTYPINVEIVEAYNYDTEDVTGNVRISSASVVLAKNAAADAVKAAEKAAAKEYKGDRITISIWSTFTEEQEAYLKKTAQEFNATQDKYEVVVQSQPYQGFTGTVYNAVLDHQGPDIIFNYGSEAAKYVNAGLVANLDEYIYDEEIGIPNFDELLPEYLLREINGFEDGHIHWLPGYTTGPILYYNKTLLDELGLNVPTTWEELESFCIVIKDFRPDLLPFGIDSSVDLVQTVLVESGANYIDSVGKEVGFADAREAVVWLGQMLREGLFSLNTPSSIYFSNDFNAGMVAMYYGSSAGVSHINPNGFEYGVAPAPSSHDGNAAYTPWNRGPIVFSANGDDHAEGAYLFVKYMLTTPEIAEGWAETMLALTPWLNAQQVEGYDAYVASQPALAAVQANFGIGVSFPSVTGAAEVRNAIRDMIHGIADGEDPTTALAACVEKCNNALQGK